MRVSDIITITTNKSGATATLAGTSYPACTSNGKIAAHKATVGLLDEIKDHLKNVHERRYFFSPSGKTVFALYHTYGGWGYDIMNPRYTGPSYCGFNSGINFRVAYDLVKQHAASYVEEEV